MEIKNIDMESLSVVSDIRIHVEMETPRKDKILKNVAKLTLKHQNLTNLSGQVILIMKLNLHCQQTEQ